MHFNGIFLFLHGFGFGLNYNLLMMDFLRAQKAHSSNELSAGSRKLVCFRRLTIYEKILMILDEELNRLVSSEINTQLQTDCELLPLSSSLWWFIGCKSHLNTLFAFIRSHRNFIKYLRVRNKEAQIVFWILI